MRRLPVFAVIAAIAVLSGCSSTYRKVIKSDKAPSIDFNKLIVNGVLITADFDRGIRPNNLGGNFDSWMKDVADKTQGCLNDFIKPGYDGTGKCLKLTYDVDSPNQAYNGFYTKLESLDGRLYSKFSFWLKGDEELGYTTRIKLELKSDKEIGTYYVNNISDGWEVVEIPLKNFDGITDFRKLMEFVIVFEDYQATKTGAIYIDDICFIK